MPDGASPPRTEISSNPAFPPCPGTDVPEASDVSRRSFLRTAGQGLIAAGLTAGPLAGAVSGAVPLEPPDRQPPDLKVPGPPDRKLGWAVVGLGELALTEVMPAFLECQKSRPVALVSGHPDKARKVADHYGIDPKSLYGYENFDSIRDNPAVDVVYVILPNSMHAEYTIRAARAGKHVLCEKPMASTSGECRQMIDACRQANRKLMIAYRLRHEPYNNAGIEIARKKEFGRIEVIEASNVQNTQAPNIRLSAKLGGGPLYDVGVYCINACRYVSGEEPAEVTGMAFQPPDVERFREVPESVIWTMRFPSGVLAHCSCGFGGGPANRWRASCEKGWFGLEPAYAYQNLVLHTGRGPSREERRFPQINHFTAEMDYFSDCVANDKPVVTPGEEGLADLRVVEAINESIRSGRVVNV